MGVHSKIAASGQGQTNTNSARPPYEKQKRKDGKPNPKYVDLLEEDKPIAGQKFACVSFVSPETILKSKQIFVFEEFLKTWEMSKSMEKYVQFLSFLSFKYKMDLASVTKDFEGFVKEERETLVQGESVAADFKTYVDKNEESLDNKFNTQNEFQTSLRGLKIRGVFPTLEEAELRCKMLREVDPSHDVYVGPVGLWMPWEPEAYKTGRVEYMEDELNQLMHEKTKNEDFAKSAFDQRVKESKKKAIEENILNAEKFGSSLTQNIDEHGNLIGVGQMNTQESSLKAGGNEISSADIHAELFEGDNIVVGKTDNGQSELLSGPFASV